MFKDIIIKARNFKLYMEWRKRKRKRDKRVVAIERGCGYYIPIGVALGYDIYEPRPLNLDGEVITWKLLYYVRFDNPYDMIKEAYYQILGYADDNKLFKDMTFVEFYNSKQRHNSLEHRVIRLR